MKKRAIYFSLIIWFLLLLFSILAINNINIEKSILKVTNEHPFYLNGRWVEAKDLKVGDELLTINNKKARITNIKDINEEVDVYNLEVENYSDFIVNGIIVHNSNNPKKDCLLGSCKVQVIDPFGGIEEMSFSKFYQRYQNNPHLKIIGEDGNPLDVDKIIRTVNIEGETQIVRFKIGKETLRLTSSHEIQLADGSFVKAVDLRKGMLVKTEKGPIFVEELTTYKASGVKAYDIRTSKPYSLIEGGPVLKSSSIHAGVLPGASNWDPSRIYARIVSDDEYTEIMRTRVLRPAEEGQLIPTIDAQNKKVIERLSAMSGNELKDYYQHTLGGKGPNKKIIFFRSPTPPEVDGIFVRGVSDIQEAKFPGGRIEIIN